VLDLLEITSLIVISFLFISSI